MGDKDLGLLTIAEICGLYGVTPGTVRRRLRSHGVGPVGSRASDAGPSEDLYDEDQVAAAWRRPRPAPGSPREKVRAIQGVDDRMWADLGMAAAAGGLSRSDVVRGLIAWYLNRPDAQLPERPE